MIPPTTYHQRIWAIQTPEATEVFAASCGLEHRIRRVLAARINIDVRENWASKHHSGGGIQGKNLKKISTVQQWTENPTEFYKRPATKPFFSIALRSAMPRYIQCMKQIFAWDELILKLCRCPIETHIGCPRLSSNSTSHQMFSSSPRIVTDDISLSKATTMSKSETECVYWTSM